MKRGREKESATGREKSEVKRKRKEDRMTDMCRSAVSQ